MNNEEEEKYVVKLDLTKLMFWKKFDTKTIVIGIMTFTIIGMFLYFNNNKPKVKEVDNIPIQTRDSVVIKYVESSLKETVLKDEIKSLQKQLETYQLQNSELKSILKHQKDGKGQIKYFGTNVSVETVLNRMSSITNKYPIKNEVSNK